MCEELPHCLGLLPHGPMRRHDGGQREGRSDAAERQHCETVLQYDGREDMTQADRNALQPYMYFHEVGVITVLGRLQTDCKRKFIHDTSNTSITMCVASSEALKTPASETEVQTHTGAATHRKQAGWKAGDSLITLPKVLQHNVILWRTHRLPLTAKFVAQTRWLAGWGFTHGTPEVPAMPCASLTASV